MKTWINRLFKRPVTQPVRKTQYRLLVVPEQLEDRLAPAVTSYSTLDGGTLQINLDTINEAVSIQSDGTILAVSTNTSITGDGSTFSAADVLRIVVTDPGVLAGQSLKFVDNLSLPSGLQVTGVEAVTFSGSINAGTGAAAINVTAPGTLAVNPDVIITGGGGGVTLTAQGESGSGPGISIGANAKVITTGGSVSLEGTGADTTAQSIGVVINGTVRAGGLGKVNVTGTGGASNGSNNYGVHLDTANGKISSAGGAVLVKGIGGGVGASIVNHGVVISSASLITSEDGGPEATVTVEGTGGNLAGTGSSNIGVFLNGTSKITSGGGPVLVKGTGGGGGTSSLNYGVVVGVGSSITNAGTGIGSTVTIEGQGGNTSGDANYGILVSSSGSQITSSGGPVLVKGAGGGAGAAAFNYGVFLQSGGTITSAGTETGATVTVEGKGGNTTGTGSGNFGVYVDISSKITSSGGAVLVKGTGGGAGASTANSGVLVNTGSIITSAGTAATVTVEGTAGNTSGTGDSNRGVFIAGTGSKITSGGGAIHVIATGTSNSEAIRLGTGASIISGGNGAINLIADSINLVTGNGGISAGTGTISIQTLTDGAIIDLGGNDLFSSGPITLGLTDGELDGITASKLVIGDQKALRVHFSDSISRSTLTDVVLTGRMIAGTAAGTDLDLAGGTLSFGVLSKGNYPALLSEIDGTTPDTQFDQLRVAGNVNIEGLDVELPGSYLPVLNDTFELITATGNLTGSFVKSYAIMNGDVPAQLLTTGNTGRAVANPTETPSLVVNITADVFDPFDNKTSLREAVERVNTIGGEQTITFDPALSGKTITLQDKGLELLNTGTGNSFTIVGPSGGLTISGGDAVRVLTVLSDTKANLSNLTITGGNGGGRPSGFGGGIQNTGALILTNVTVRDNTTTGFASALGGGIYNFGTLGLIQSDVSNNFAENDGGGIYNTGMMVVVNSTISYNTSQSFGGGIYNKGTLTIINGTIAGNVAGVDGTASKGGGIYNNGQGAATTTLANTILAGNFRGDQTTPDDIIAEAVTADYSLIGNPGSAFIQGSNNLLNVNPNLGDRGNNGGLTNIIPLLASSPAINAGSNGLVPTGVDVDQRGTGFARIVGGTVDIGAFEVQVPPETPSLIVDITTDVVNNTDNKTSLREAVAYANTLKGIQKITFTGELSEATITLINGELTFTRTGSGNLTSITAPTGGVTISGNNSSRIFMINSGVTASLNGLKLTKGFVVPPNQNADAYGGAIYSQGTLTVTNSTFTDNKSENYAGAIYSENGTLTVNSSSFTNNFAGSSGNAIYSYLGTTKIAGSTFTGHNAIDSGDTTIYSETATLEVNTSQFSNNRNGDIYGDGSGVTVSDSTFTNNLGDIDNGGVIGVRDGTPATITNVQITNGTTGYGGINLFKTDATITGSVVSGMTVTGIATAIVSTGSNPNLTITNTQIKDNTSARGYGGGVYFRSAGNLQITGSTITGNKDTKFFSYGGGVHADSGSATISNTTISNNSAGYGGGGVYATNGDMKIIGSTITDNTTLYYGGGIYASSITHISNSTISGNKSTDTDGVGGGIYSDAQLSLDSSTVSNNSSVLNGGGIYLENDEFNLSNISNSTISGNSAGSSGGGIYTRGPGLTVRNTTVTANRADSDGSDGGQGGGFYLAEVDTSIYNTIVAGNFAGKGTNANDVALEAASNKFLASSSYNLIGDVDTSGGLVNGINGNLVGVSPLLGPLANNGGSTKTHALLSGSPAIDAGNNQNALDTAGKGLTLDQRGNGFQRIFQTDVDIGAFEFVPDAIIGGIAFKDSNGDGVKQTAESILAGIAVELFRSIDRTVGNNDDVSVGTNITGADGKYSFTVRGTDNYYGVFRVPAGYQFTVIGDPDDGTANFVQPTGISFLSVLSPSISTYEINAGVTGSASPRPSLIIGGPGNDFARDIARDADGNTYIVGYYTLTTDFDPGVGTSSKTAVDQEDIFVAKYSPSGALVWVQAAGGANSDSALGVTLGADGQVYVAGIFGATTNFPSATGNIPVVSAGSGDIFIWKLDANGNTSWVRRAGGTSQDSAVDLATDAAGNLFVTGTFNGTANFDSGTGKANLTTTGNGDVFVWKLDSAGNTVWARQGGGSESDGAEGIAIDSTGNVIVSGFFRTTANFNAGTGTASFTSAGNADVFVWKLDSAGNTVWASRGGSSNTDDVSSPALDAVGNLYIAGSFQLAATFNSEPVTGSGGYDVYVWKLNSADGSNAWVRTVGNTGTEYANAIDVNSKGDVFVVGGFDKTAAFPTTGGTTQLTNSADGSIFIWSLDNAGNGHWARALTSTGNGDGTSILSDANGNAVIAGFFFGTVDTDPTAGKSILSANAYDGFLATIAPPEPTVTVAGEMSGAGGSVVELFSSVDKTVGGADDVSLGQAIIAADGKFTFTTNPGAASGPNYYVKVRVPSGLSYGQGLDSTGTSLMLSGTGPFNLNASVTGTPASVTSVQLGSAGGSDETTGVARDSAGNLYVTGLFYNTIDFDPGAGVFNLTSPGGSVNYLAKYSPAGALISAQMLPNIFIEKLVVDAADNLFVGGYTLGGDFAPGFTVVSNGSVDPFIWKIDASGKTQWVRNGGGIGNDRGNDIAVDAAGNSYITGSFAGNATFGSVNLSTLGSNDIYVWKLDADGKTVWARSAGSTGIDIGEVIGVDDNGNVVVGGNYRDNATFNAGTGTASLTSSALNDIFVWKLDSAGNTVWARTGGSTNNDGLEDLGVDAAGNVYLVGGFFGAINLNAGTGKATLTANGKLEASFVWKLDSNGNTEWARNTDGADASYAFTLAVDAAGNSIVSGYFNGATTFSGGTGSTTLQPQGEYEAYVWRIDSAGNSQYVQRVGGSGSTYTQPWSIVTDAKGDAYVALYFFDFIDIDQSAGVSKVTSAGGTDGLLVKIPAIQNPVNGTFTVGNLSDVDDGDYSSGQLSFREAINLASLTPGPSVIAIPDSMAGQTITLTAGPLQFTATGAGNATTITGPAGGINFNGNSKSQVFSINSDVFVNLSNLTITGGNGRSGIGASGGAISNSGTLALTSVTVSGNGTTGSDSSVGGGIFNVGTLTLTNSTVTDNVSDGPGGGIYNAGTVTLTNSTISNNRTLASQVGSGGGYFHDVQGQGTSTLNNSIIAGNFRGTGNTADDVGGPVTGNNSLFGTSTGATITGPNNLVNVDPLLAPFGNYGGPVKTYALLPGSPAIDAGEGTGTDVRGLPSVGKRDIGTFESQGFQLRVVSGNDQTVLINSAFGKPLQVRVTANNPAEPVQGGQVSFITPGTGPSAQNNNLNRVIVPILSNGTAETVLIANDQAGAFQVVASTPGASSVDFNLQNGTIPVPILPSIPAFEEGKPFDISFPATGNPPATYELIGTLPQGVTFTTLPDGSARLQGTPTQTGVFQFTIAANSVVGSTSKEFSLTIGTTPVLSLPTIPFPVAGKDFNFTLPAVGRPAATYQLLGKLPQGLIFTTNPDGSATLSGIPTSPGRFRFTLSATNTVSSSSSDFELFVQSEKTFNTVTTNAGLTKVTDLKTGITRDLGAAFPGFTGEVRVSMGDVNNDGTTDVIYAAGALGGPRVRVIDGVTGAELQNFFAYDPAFRGGVYVSTGDVNSDGMLDIITGAGASGGPHVRVFSGRDGSELYSFFAFDPNYRGGVTVASADVNGDGFDDLVVGSATGSSHVRAFSGKDGSELASFFADPGASAGIFVSAGDLDGDGKAEIVTGAASGSPQVRSFRSRDGKLLSEFSAYDPSFQGGVRVGVAEVNGKKMIVTGAGPGGGPHVRGFNPDSGLVELNYFAEDPSFTGGVFVG